MFSSGNNFRVWKFIKKFNDVKIIFIIKIRISFSDFFFK